MAGRSHRSTLPLISAAKVLLTTIPTMKNFLIATAILVTTSLHAFDSVEAQTRPATNWRWGARVDESTFLPGKNGVVIHAAPDGKGNGDGSATQPLNLDSALKQAQETVRSMEAAYQRVNNTATAPLWLRITRRGNEFAAFTAPDNNGQAGAWSPAGEAKTIAMGANVYAGLLVNANQAWPHKDTYGEATFDNASVQGKSVPSSAWQSMRLGVVRGAAKSTTSANALTIQGNGIDSNTTNNWEDSGQFTYLPLSGDGDVTVRLARLTPSEHSKSVSAALMVREKLSPGAKMMELEVAIKGDNSGLWRGFRTERATPGRDVKVLLAPGTYRGGMWLPERDEIAQNRVFAVEGVKVNGQAGQVIFSGSEEWNATTWKDEGNGVYSHEWKQDWGGDKLSDRRELVFLTPQGGAMQRLNGVMPADWKAAPGSFTVNEAGINCWCACPMAGMRRAGMPHASKSRHATIICWGMALTTQGPMITWCCATWYSSIAPATPRCSSTGGSSRLRPIATGCSKT
jgi:hypothetical protein